MKLHHVPGDGPPIVLLHGASGCGATWDPSAWSWANLWVADLPGRGLAAGEQPLATIEALSHDLSDALKSVAARPWLVGHSLGGAIALQRALDAPQQLGGIVLIASSARLRVSPAIFEAVRASTPETPLRLDFAFSPSVSSQVTERYNTLTASVSRSASLADWTACDGFDVRSRLTECELPVIVMYGDHDVLTPPRHQQSLVQALPHAKAHVLTGLGHMAPFEAPHPVAMAARERIDDFMTEA